MKTVDNETKRYCEDKLAILVKDHNHYKKVKDAGAVRDYRIAIDNLIYYAERQGIKLAYTVSKSGYLTVA